MIIETKYDIGDKLYTLNGKDIVEVLVEAVCFRRCRRGVLGGVYYEVSIDYWDGLIRDENELYRTLEELKADISQKEQVCITSKI